MEPATHATPAGPATSDVEARRAARLAAPRLTRELRTIAAMLRIACRDQHGDAERNAEQLCTPCAELLDYARKRLAHCPYGPEKPTCVNCPIHCYGKRQREEVREVMRYAGPRMLLRHPVLAIAHLIDGRRPAPPPPAERRAAAAATRRAGSPAANASGAAGVAGTSGAASAPASRGDAPARTPVDTPRA
jgi:Nitrous oxide-stimulated promoter